MFSDHCNEVTFWACWCSFRVFSNSPVCIQCPSWQPGGAGGGGCHRPWIQIMGTYSIKCQRNMSQNRNQSKYMIESSIFITLDKIEQVRQTKIVTHWAPELRVLIEPMLQKWFSEMKRISLRIIYVHLPMYSDSNTHSERRWRHQDVTAQGFPSIIKLLCPVNNKIGWVEHSNFRDSYERKYDTSLSPRSK